MTSMSTSAAMVALCIGLVAGPAQAADAPQAAASAAKPKAGASAPAVKPTQPAPKGAQTGGAAGLSKDQGANTSTVKAPPKPKTPDGTTPVPEVPTK